MPDIGSIKVEKVSCGGIHTAILLEDKTVRVFGDNSEGQCDIKNT